MSKNSSFDLYREQTYAQLSASDLEGIGKQASQLFLHWDMPLNDAVVKLAHEHPGISQEQVKRIVEHANVSTYRNLFEKQAGHKNVEFHVADAREVLHALDSAARPVMLKAAALEYGADPVSFEKRSKDLEADLALMRMFGVEPTSDALEKCAMGGPPDMTDSSQFLQQMPPGDEALQKGIEYALAEKARGDGIGNYDALSSVLDAVKNTAETMSTKPNPKEMLRAQEDAMKAQAKAVPGAPMDPAAGGDPSGGDPAAQGAGGPVEMGGAPPPPPAPLTAPMQGMKVASLIKEAQAYVRAGRPHAERVLEGLEKAASLEAIRSVTRREDGFSCEPYRGLVEAWQMLTKLAEEAAYAKDKNALMAKEASAEFSDRIVRSLLGGTAFGDIVEVMSDFDAGYVKEAMSAFMPTLRKHGFTPERLQADFIQYEMEKGASSRIPNPKHPLALSFSAYVKLAESQAVLEQAYEDAFSLWKEADALVKQASVLDAGREFLTGAKAFAKNVGGIAAHQAGNLSMGAKMLGQDAKGALANRAASAAQTAVKPVANNTLKHLGYAAAVGVPATMAAKGFADNMGSQGS